MARCRSASARAPVRRAHTKRVAAAATTALDAFSDRVRAETDVSGDLGERCASVVDEQTDDPVVNGLGHNRNHNIEALHLASRTSRCDLFEMTIVGVPTETKTDEHRVAVTPAGVRELIESKFVYEFSEGSRDMRELLGGKGANVAEMMRVLGPERVPAGFTITTEACVAYMNAGNTFLDGLQTEVAEALLRLEERAGKTLGDPEDPLLVSVRSGARDSMPGMMDTVLNLGLNDDSVRGLAERTGNERFAWDSYRRFVQMYGNVVAGVPGQRFEAVIKAVKRDRGVTNDTQLDVDALRQLAWTFQAYYAFPSDPQAQLRGAIRAVFDSWMSDRAVHYRRINRIPDDWGTAVNVQQMVFGNKGPTSGSGVAFSRDEVTGAPEPSGDFLPNAQGEDVVSGVRTPKDIRELKDWQPEVHRQLMNILRTLERHYGDMQDTEFTVEEGRLYMLQTRNAKRPAQAAVRFAVDAVREGLLNKPAALMTIDAENLDALLHPTFDPRADYKSSRAASRRRRERRRARSCSPQTRPSPRRRRAGRSCSSGPSRRPTTSRAFMPRAVC